MSFHEIRFPTEISRGATGGPERRTEIVALGSGYEERNAPWAQSRRRYNAGYGVKTLNDLHAVITFFEARKGRLYGFRWKDHADFKSAGPQDTVTALDQPLGTGDGATAGFQLQKTYTSGGVGESRTIIKPVAGSVLVAVDGVSKTEDVDYTIDTATGLVSFLPGKIPDAATVLTAGFEYDVPVRFDTDYLSVDHTAFGAGEIPSIPILEVRL